MNIPEAKPDEEPVPPKLDSFVRPSNSRFKFKAPTLPALPEPNLLDPKKPKGKHVPRLSERFSYSGKKIHSFNKV